MLAEDSEHGLSHALHQLFGQPGRDLGIVTAGRFGQSQETVEAGQADRLPEPQEPLAIQVKHLVEEPAEVIPMLIRKRHACVGGFLPEVLPVAPAADVFQMPQCRETRVGKNDRVDPIGKQNRRVRRDDRTEAVAHQHGVIDLESVHDRQAIAGLIGRSVAVVGQAAIAVAAQVEGRHPERAAEDSHGFAQEPDREVAGDAVNQDDVGPGACLLIVKVDSVCLSLGMEGVSLSKVSRQEFDQFADRRGRARFSGRPRRSAREKGVSARSVSEASR